MVKWYITAPFKLFLWLLFFLYVIVPLLILLFPVIQTKFAFFFIYKCPVFSDFNDFKSFRLSETGSRNFYLQNDGNSLGMWHLLPKSSISSEKLSDKHFQEKLNDGKPVILYFHGNALNRGGKHMVDLYRVLQDMDYHIVAVDYRGYGDSSGVPYTEDDLVSDALAAFVYVRAHLRSPSFYIWGHSLGTGITSKLVKILSEMNEAPLGIILESPFNKMKDAAYHHPISALYRNLPYFDYIFIQALDKNKIYFDSETNLKSVNIPIMILHAEDDHMVPYILGKRLYDALKSHDKNKDVELHKFEASKGYKHKYIWKDANLPSIVRKFIAKTSAGRQTKAEK